MRGQGGIGNDPQVESGSGVLNVSNENGMIENFADRRSVKIGLKPCLMKSLGSISRTNILIGLNMATYLGESIRNIWTCCSGTFLSWKTG